MHSVFLIYCLIFCVSFCLTTKFLLLKYLKQNCFANILPPGQLKRYTFLKPNYCRFILNNVALLKMYILAIRKQRYLKMLEY